MAPRPAKRRKVSVIGSSDDDEPSSLPVRSSNRRDTQLSLDHDPNSKLVLSPSRSTNSKALSKRITSTGSPKSSPEKSRKGKSVSKEPEKKSSLHNFFNKASEEQRWARKTTPVELYTDVDGELGDAIEDDHLTDDGLFDNEDSQNSILNAQGSVSSLSSRLGIPRPDLRTGTQSHRFVKPSVPTKRTSTGEEILKNENLESQSPWAERYGPSNLEELAVHKKKVQDVQKWLEDVTQGRDRRKLLVLKGPAGTGKTTTLSLLADALQLQLVSWQNPTTHEPGIAASSGHQFDDFVNRGAFFGGLDFSPPKDADDSKQSPNLQRVLVVEEFPATISRTSNSLKSFRTTINQFLARSPPSSFPSFRGTQSPQDREPPMVLIISETLLTSSTAVSDSFTAHRLLGPDILNHPLATLMEFNPVAPTFISKALDLVVKKEARDSKRRRVPGHSLLQRLAEMGDVRSAVNSLEFLCVRGDDSADWSGTVASKSKKSGKDTNQLTDMEKNSLQLVSQRETTMDMFHAAGKIMYNKREDPKVQDSRAAPPPKPPDHLMYLYNPKASQVDIEALLNETGTDIQTFISTLHENYVLSCNGDSFVDSLEMCAEILSLSDVLNPESRRTRRSNQGGASSNSYSSFQVTNSESLRQDEISFQTATRGLLFHLPYPVSRAAPASGRKSDSFKMFYPTSLRIWKPTEEIEGQIALYSNNPEMLSTTSSSSEKKVSAKADESGVASWQSRASNQNVDHFAQRSQQLQNSQSPSDKDTPSTALATAFNTLTLEVLPYLTKIRLAKNQNVKDLSKITQVRSIVLPSLDDQSLYADDEEPPDNVKSESNSFSVMTDFTSTATLRGSIIGTQTATKPEIAGSKRLTDLVNSLSSSGSAANPLRATIQNGTNQSFRGGQKTIKTEEDTEDSRIEIEQQAADMEKLYISEDDIED